MSDKRVIPKGTKLVCTAGNPPDEREPHAFYVKGNIYEVMKDYVVGGNEEYIMVSAPHMLERYKAEGGGAYFDDFVELEAYTPVKEIGKTYLDFSKPRTDTQNLVNVKSTNPKDAVGIRKVSLSVIPANVLMELGLGGMEGSLKYGRHNYREAGVRYSVYYDATLRHLMAWWEGQDLDPDSGISHVTKAINGLIVLRDSMLRGNATDDRPPPSADFMPELNRLAGELLDKYPNPKPAICNKRD